MILDICDILTHQEFIKSYMVHNMESKKTTKNYIQCDRTVVCWTA